MHRRQFLKFSLYGGVLSSITMTGCTVSQAVRGVRTGHYILNGQYTAAVASQIPGTGIPGVDSLLRGGFKSFLDQISKNWRDNKIPTEKTYVKYSENYKSRAIVDFENGKIQVETIIDQQTKKALTKAIVQTLLTPEDPSSIDLYSAEEPRLGERPFLLDLVQNQSQKPIQNQWQAQDYAEYLIQKHYRQYSLKGKKRFAVNFQMVPDFKTRLGKHYNYWVSQYAKRYQLEPSLIYGIIETESAFNPFAVSSAPAYGLMQIVPETAGRDVYRFLKQRDGIPNKTQLFSPATNIEYGTTYLHLLFNRYLNNIKDPQTQQYCVISAYNTGSGNVLKSFHYDRNSAIRIINRLSSDQVYSHLLQKLSTSEARNYLPKVIANKRKYEIF